MAGARFILKFLILLAICLCGGSVFSFYSLLNEQNDTTESSVILVEKGENLTQIAKKLKNQDLLKSISVFKVAARLSGKAGVLKAGEYKIPAKASAKEILDILVSGQTMVRRVTIPEGKTSRQIFDLLLQTPGLFGDLPTPPENGFLLPETYVFSYGLPRRVILQRMRDSMSKTINELWPDRQTDLPYTTKEEAVILASIVEKETAVPEERPRIAGVFVNRLRKGMRLQTDPTVIYAVTDGTMELKRRLTHKDLKQSHPYNTYLNKGLPPGPICNPGRDSLYAVLHPVQTNEIYFVADGTGGHVFSKTFDEHRRNILAWKRARVAKKRARLMAAKKASLQKKNVAAVVSKSTPVVLKTTENDAESAEIEENLEHEDISADIIDDVLIENSLPVKELPKPLSAEPVQTVKKVVSRK